MLFNLHVGPFVHDNGERMYIYKTMEIPVLPPIGTTIYLPNCPPDWEDFCAEVKDFWIQADGSLYLQLAAEGDGSEHMPINGSRLDNARDLREAGWEVAEYTQSAATIELNNPAV